MKKNIFANKFLKYGIITWVVFTTLFTFLFSGMNVGATTKIADESTILKFNESLGDSYSTEYSGRIWTDKSVFSNSVTVDEKTYDLEADEEFINIFSALATADTISGKTQTPVDVVFIVDMSNSMNQNRMDNGSTRLVNMVNALDDSVQEILKSNKDSRIAVVNFNRNSTTILPLDHYTLKNGTNRIFTLNGTTLITNAVRSNGTTINNQQTPSRSGTNIQKGFANGMNLLATEQNTTITIDGTTVTRIPSVILLSDGSPTSSSNWPEWWASANDTTDQDYENQTYERNGLKAMITAAYYKDAIDRNYFPNGVTGNNKTTVYTIGMGLNDIYNSSEKNLARVTVNPTTYFNANNTISTNIRNTWNNYVKGNSPTLNNYKFRHPDFTTDGQGMNRVTNRYPSNYDIDSTNKIFYVDHYYDADSASTVTEVFKTIVSDIAISAAQVPTEVKNGDALGSGYITYVDPIGEYMEVKDVKSIIFSNKDQEFTNPTVNIIGNKTTYTFHGVASTFAHGEQDISNLIIEVEKDTNGNETMTIKVPAALIPLRINSIELDQNDQIVKHTQNGALPLHVIYSVGLQKDVLDMNNTVNPKVVSPTYIANHSNEDGTVNFYSNLYSGNTVNGVNVGNATVEFEPSHTNPFYYIQKNIPVYTDEACTNKVTSLDYMIANQTYYYKEHYYHGNESKFLIVARTGEQLAKANLVMIDGYVHRAAGSPRPNRILEFEGTKTNNITSTAEEFYYPTFVYADGSNDPYEGKYKIYLGNNGVLQANATGSLAITKTVTADEGLTAPDLEFPFTIQLKGDSELVGPFIAVHTDANGNEIHTSEVTNGSIVYLKANETVTIQNLPYNTNYEVIETPVSGFTVTPTTGKVEGTIQAGKVSKAEFNNHYSVTPTTADGFKVSKVFTGREWLDTDTFTFVLESKDLNTPMPKGSNIVEGSHQYVTTVVSKDKQSSEFGKITYTKPGTYTYVIFEEQTSIPGVSYSGAMYEVSVVVEDTGNGTLTKTVTMTQLASDNGADLNTIVDVMTFTNTFDAESVNWIPVGTKTYIDNSNQKPLTNGMFTFKVEALTENAPLPSNSIVSNASIEIAYEAITFTKEHAGLTSSKPNVYEYKFTEIIPDTKVVGMTYDTTEYIVKVSVYLDGENIVVIPTYPNDKTHLEFTNTYTPTPTSIELGGNKVITGRKWLENETFTFNLTATNDAAKALTIKNQATATEATKAFTFDAIQITKPGIYTFEIKEEAQNAGGMTYDANVVSVTVTGVDNNGVLEATILYDNSEEQPVFVNTYTSIFTSTPINIDGIKTLTGQSLEAGEFFFVVEPINEAPLIQKELFVTNNEDDDHDGVATIDILKDLTFTSAGTYQYKVYERIPSTPVIGMTYDTNYFIITIEVVDNLDGTLTANKPVITKYDKNDNKLVGNEIEFLNQYVPTPTEIKIPVLTKVLEGFRNQALQENEFEFKLTLEEATLLNGTTIQTSELSKYIVLPTTTTVKNDANGKIQFDNITFKQAGLYTIKIEEVIPSDAQLNADGTYTLGALTYTNEKVYATIRVVDDNLGTLTATVFEEIGGGKFENQYATRANLDVEVNKVFTGREWTKGDAFTFELLIADVITQEAINNGYITLPNKDDQGQIKVTIDHKDTDKKALFGNIQFTKPGTYQFIVREIPGTIPGVNYDGTSKTIQVVVTDNNDGTMTITGDVKTVNNQYVASTTFKNVYDANSTELSGHEELKVTKEFTGREWLDTDQFVFILQPNDDLTIQAINDKKVSLTSSVLVINSSNKELAHFGNITFNEKGTYKFKVYELTANNFNKQPTDIQTQLNTLGITIDKVSLPSVTYDHSIKEITVTVQDDGNGNLYIPTPVEKDALTFTNKYSNTPAQVALSVDKVFKGREWTDEYEFSFELTARTKETKDAQNAGTVIIPTSTITIDSTNSNKSFEAITFKQPGTYEFTVREIAQNDPQITYDQKEYVVIVEVTDNNVGQLIATSNINNIEFTNVYTPEPIEVQFSGTKTLIGRELKDNEFMFNISSVNNAPLPIKTTTTNIGKNVQFEKITYTQEGTYEYIISEIKSTLGGIQYDTNLVNVTVTINYDSTKGVFTKDIKYNGNNTFEFVNTYTTTNTDPITIEANKVVTPTLGNKYTLQGGEFTFSIESDSQEQTFVNTDAHGKATLFKNLIFTEEGTYVYTVKEVNTNQTGMTYDTSVYTITIQVKDDGNGKLQTSTTITKDGKEVKDITFNNAYDPIDATVTLEGIKTLDGKPLEANEFTFVLAASEQTPLPEKTTVTNNTNGTFVFGQITYDKPGTYIYTIKEVAGNNSGITYDTNTVYATVTVKDINGKLEATVIYENTSSTTNKAEFTNTYTATFDDKTAISLKGNKTLTGQSLEAKEFKFNIQQVLPEQKDLGTVTNDENGMITFFNELTYTKAGTYVYEIKEIVENPVSGMTYDKNVYEVTVKVSDDYEGTLSASQPIIKVNGQKVTEITFVNRYVPNKNTVELPLLKKVIKGYRHTTLQPNEFTFELDLVSANPTNGIILPTETLVGNGENGNIVFDEITFTKAGTYTIQVSEVIPSDKAQGMTYDTERFEITYEVIDDSNGNLTAKVKNTKGDHTFTNIYESQGSLELEVEKVLKGREWFDTDTFTFELLVTEDATLEALEKGYISLPTNLKVKVDKDNHKALFDEIIITKEGTYDVVVREVTTNKIPGIHYDSHARHIEITAIDNNKGGIDVTYTIKEEQTLTFTNVYDTESTELNGHDNLVVVKEFTGRPANKWLDTDKFVFTLAAKDEATAKAIENKDVILETTKLEITNTNKAYAHFANITFKKAGTYNFTITEEATDILGVTNDPNNVRSITVKVEDKGDGTLEATRTDTENLVFKNIYTVKEIELEGKTYLEVNKELAGRDWFDTDTFTFTLKPANEITNKAVEAKDIILPTTQINLTKEDNGSKAFGNITFKAPGVYQFAITENKGNIYGMSYDEHEVIIDVVVADDNKGQLIVAAPTYAGSMTFTNTYTPDGIYVTFEGTKELTGRTLKADEFEFEITAINNAPLPAVTKVTNNADGTIKFSSIAYNKEGVYEYEIKEINGKLAGINYDTQTVKAIVTVTNNKATGKLEKRVEYVKADGKGFTFTNRYTTENTDEVTFSANKVVTPSVGNTYTLEANTFKFHLKPAVSNPASDPIQGIVEVTNSADGTVFFTNATYTEEGTYVYTIHEVDNFLPGISYDNSVYTITVKVSDDETTAKLQKEVTITKDGKEVKEITFNNTYNPLETNALIYGQKELTGGHKELETKEFAFTINAVTENAPLPEKTTVRNSATGFFNFGSITFKQEGVYTYEIREENEHKQGYTYDDTVYTITVTVRNDQLTGELKATVSGLEKVKFVNNYAPTPVTVDVLGKQGGLKELDGRPLLEGEFTFELIDENTKVIQTTNNADGTFRFKPITFTKAGTYHYTVVEKESAVDGVTFDETIYEIQVNVTDNNGKLEATLTFFEEEKEVNRVEFTNEYQAAPTELTISAIKELVGRVLVENEFTFNLYRANEFYDANELLNSAKNNAQGVVTFDKVTFDAVGTYYFVVNEEVGTLERVTYDTTRYGYEVIVTDDLVGHLKVDQVTITNLNTQELASTIFRNIFTPKPEDISVEIKVQKTVKNTGNVIIGPKDFEFVLEDLNTGAKQVLTTDENGNAFFKLDFSEKDIDQTFSFKLTETKGTLEEMEYDTKAYHIQVHVSLNENNQLIATVTNNGTTVEQVLASFENINYANNDPILTIVKSQAVNGGKPVTEKLTAQKDDTVTYYLTVKNTGDGEANNVVITDALPQGLTYVDNSASNSGNYENGILTWNIETLLPNEEITVSFKAKVNEDDITVKNIANATADNHDDTPSNEVEITVVPEPKTPDTSDNSNVNHYTIMMILAAAMILILKKKESFEA